MKALVNLDRVTAVAKAKSVPVGEEKAQLDKIDVEGKTVPVESKTVDGTDPVPPQP